MISRRTLELDPITVGELVATPIAVHREISFGGRRAGIRWSRLSPGAIEVRRPDGTTDRIRIGGQTRAAAGVLTLAAAMLLIRRYRHDR